MRFLTEIQMDGIRVGLYLPRYQGSLDDGVGENRREEDVNRLTRRRVPIGMKKNKLMNQGAKILLQELNQHNKIRLWKGIHGCHTKEWEYRGVVVDHSSSTRQGALHAKK